MLFLTQAAELEAALAERTQQMSEAETTLKLKELEFERRVTSLQKEHASKLATVLQQATAVAPAHRGGLQQLAGVSKTAILKQCYPANNVHYWYNNNTYTNDTLITVGLCLTLSNSEGWLHWQQEHVHSVRKK